MNRRHTTVSYTHLGAGGINGAGTTGSHLAAEYVLELFKTIRGYGGSAICATQDLNDFFSLDEGRFGKGIINNSKTKIVLNLEDEEAQRVQSVMHLSEAEVMEITHFERGSGPVSYTHLDVYKRQPRSFRLLILRPSIQ